MHMMWFTERQYHYDPETEAAKSHLLETQILRNRSFFGLPNQNFDAEMGSMLLNQYIDEKVYSEDLGFDGLMLNEHHGTPFCLGSVMDVEAAVLAPPPSPQPPWAGPEGGYHINPSAPELYRRGAACPSCGNW